MTCKYLKGLGICGHPDAYIGDFGPDFTIGPYTKCPVELGMHICGFWEEIQCV